MREIISDLFISLDGFASGINQPAFFGYDGPELRTWVRENLNRPQTIVMGRVTYEALAKFSALATDELSLRMTALPKIVFSSQLREPLAWRNTRLLRGALADQIRELREQGDDPLRCIGSIRLVQSLIRLGVLDRLRLMIFPLFLGGLGRESAFAEYPEKKLQLLSSRMLDSRLILVEYSLTDCR